MGVQAIADLDGNGFSDIVAGSGPPLFVIDNMGPDAFLPERIIFVTASVGINRVIPTDIDADGDIDLLLLLGDGPPDPRFVNRLLINDGTGHFTDETAQRWPTGNDATTDAAVVDVDGDGLVDIVECNHVTQHRLYLGQPGGVFVDATATHMPAVFGGSAMAVGDVDGDGSPDLAIAWGGGFTGGQRDYLLLNDGTGHFTNASVRLAGRVWDIGLALGDVDRDGDLDLVCAVNGPGLSSELLRNDGLGFFTPDPTGIPPRTVAPYDSHFDAELVDLDSDGDFDIVFKLGFSGGSRTFFFNDGSGHFTEIPQHTALQVPSCYIAYYFVPADMDRDGDLDLVCTAGYCNGGQVNVMHSLSRHLAAPTSPRIGQGYVAEFNGLPGGAGILGLSFASQLVSLGAYGNLQLDLGSLFLWPTLATLDPSGHGSLTLPVPNVQALVGLRLYLQGLTFANPSAALVFTNAFGETIGP